MAREIPEVVRAAAGLAATVLDEARRLPETLPGLPVRIAGMAMQHAMKVQQQYAGLVARGDELFTGIRGEDEPGLATFDDDVPATGFRDSAFDRAGDPVPDRVGAQDSVDALAEEAPSTDEVLEELAIDEAIEAAPTLEETAPVVTEDAAALETALDESGDTSAIELPLAGAADAESVEIPTSVDVLTADGGDVATVEATVTDEGVAAPVVDEPDTIADADSTADDGTDAIRGDGPVAAESGLDTDADRLQTAEEDVAIAAGAAENANADVPQDSSETSSAPATAPVDGYDTFSIAQLRGRLRGYALTTVQDLVGYEESTRAREPYLKMLRNRLEKLEEQAIESSPLAPRG